MYTPYQIPKPRNWQDLERLCLAIWKAEWKTTSLKTYGRPGQHQDGVDVFGRYMDGQEIGAIQCKCKEEEKKLTEAIIKEEVEKAKKFKPAIKHYVIATTFDSDVELDSFTAELSQSNMGAGSFSIDLFGWQDIENLLELHTEVRDWYLNLSKRREQLVEVAVEEPEDMILRPIFRQTHYLPQSLKEKAHRKYSTMDLFGPNSLMAVVQSMQETQKKLIPVEARPISKEIHHARCLIRITIENKSEVTMKDVRVEISSNTDVKFYLEKEKDKFGLELANLQLADRMSVSEDGVSYRNMADYHPEDARGLHEFYVEPPQGAEEIELKVHVTAQDFVDDKVFKLRVEPKYHKVFCYIDARVGEPDEIEPYVEYITS
jgi:hypothetical protein